MIATFKTEGMKLVPVVAPGGVSAVVGGALPNETQPSAPAETGALSGGKGIGNWNFSQLSRMSRNPNTRRNSSRT